jgi:hypothetical protein
VLVTAQRREESGDDILDKLLGLDVGQTVHTGDTITVKLPVSGWLPIHAITAAASPYFLLGPQ